MRPLKVRQGAIAGVVLSFILAAVNARVSADPLPMFASVLAVTLLVTMLARRCGGDQPTTVSLILVTSRIGIGEFELRYPLQPLDIGDAARLMRATARILNADALARRDDSQLQEVMEKLFRNPLAMGMRVVRANPPTVRNWADRALLPVLRATVDSAADDGGPLVPGFVAAISATCQSSGVTQYEAQSGQPYVVTAAAAIAFTENTQLHP